MGSGDWLACAIQGKGAFRRFKDELHEEYPDWVQAWSVFRGIQTRCQVVQRLAGNALIRDGAVDHLLSGHPDAALLSRRML